MSLRDVTRGGRTRGKPLRLTRPKILLFGSYQFPPMLVRMLFVPIHGCSLRLKWLPALFHINLLHLCRKKISNSRRFPLVRLT